MFFIIRNPQIRQNLIDYLMTLDPDGQWEVSITKHRKGRTRQQEKLWHSWIGVLAPHFEHDTDTFKQILKIWYLGVKEVECMGRKFVIPESSSKRTREEYSELIAKTEILAIQENVKLPRADFLGLEP